MGTNSAQDMMSGGENRSLDHESDQLTSPATPSPSPAPHTPGLGRGTSCNRLLGRVICPMCRAAYYDTTSELFKVPVSDLDEKQRPTTDPLSKPHGSPVLQTSLSTSSSTGSSIERSLTCLIPFSQSSNYQTNSSFTSSLVSPQTRASSATTHDSVFSTRWGSAMTTTTGGCNFYDL